MPKKKKSKGVDVIFDISQAEWGGPKLAIRYVKHESRRKTKRLLSVQKDSNGFGGVRKK